MRVECVCTYKVEAIVLGYITSLARLGSAIDKFRRALHGTSMVGLYI